MVEVREVPDAAFESIDVALSWLQGALPRVAKGERADVVKDGKKLYDYQYADLTDVSEAVLPLLSKVGLSWITRPTMAELGGAWRFVLAYELRHESGAKIEGVWPLPDRADPQAVGSHITYGRRYCLCAVTGLAPGGDDDGTAAKEASKQGERLSTASELSLPPADTDHLVAALEPQALTPLADYWMLWEIVTKRRAADKSSPIEHDGKILTWKQLFGFSLAQRIEHLETPAQCRAFFEEAKAAGGNPRLPWIWEGTNAADRLKARGSHLNFLLDERFRVAELAVASASSIEELDKAAEMVRALDGKIAHERIQSLGKFRDQREGALRREAPSAEPIGQEESEVTEHVAASGAAYEILRAQIWKGASTIDMADTLLGSVERGEVTQEDYVQLHDLLHERPEPNGDQYTWLMWRVNEAPDEYALDEIKESIKNDGHGLDADQQRSIMGVIAGRRVTMRGTEYR